VRILGERHHRIARRRGKAKAQVAVARSILVIIWHLLSGPDARYADLGYGYYQARTDTDRQFRNHIRQGCVFLRGRLFGVVSVMRRG